MDVLLLKISNFIIANMQFVKSSSVINGKMGIVIFFYEYGRYSHNNVYTYIADILLDEILESLSSNNMDSIISVGWGIQYLLNNEYVEGCSDEVLEDFDIRVQEIINSISKIDTDLYSKITMRSDFVFFLDSYILLRENALIRNCTNLKHIIYFYQSLLLANKLCPMNFLNSCYAFVSNIHSSIDTDIDITYFTKILNDRYVKSIANHKYNAGDLKFLSKIRRDSSIFLSNIEIDDLICFKSSLEVFHYTIFELLYFDEDYNLPYCEVINDKEYDLIWCKNDMFLSLGALSGIGIGVVKRMNSLKSL